MKRFLAIAVGLAVAGTVAISFFSEESHPEFGLIRSTQWSEPHSPSRFMGLVLEVTDTFWELLNGAPPPTGKREHLHIGSNQLEWSLMSTELKSGWLYFHQPESHVLPNEYIWEFAPCARVNLADVTKADLGQAQFVRALETNKIRAAFDSDSWVETNARLTVEGRTIPVREGQIVLARLLSAPQTIYVLKFKNQVGAGTWGGIGVDYVQGEVRP
ncbi:MAG: hypothetical protein J0M24_16395 [Verrucomicrobia bacterium]|nr:hypothetical protein [Verrucomicrobiota bacterium]